MKSMYEYIKEMSIDEMKKFIYWVYQNGVEDGHDGCEDSPNISYFGGAMLYKNSDEVKNSIKEFYGDEESVPTAFTLRNLINTISGGMKIEVIIDCETIFKGTLSDIPKDEFLKRVGSNIDEEIYRVNVCNGYLIIAI